MRVLLGRFSKDTSIASKKNRAISNAKLEIVMFFTKSEDQVKNTVSSLNFMLFYLSG